MNARLMVAAGKSEEGPSGRRSPADPAGPGGQAASDRELLARSAAGETDAFRALVGRHLRSVHTIARRMLGDEAAAEDVAQETLLKLWRAGGGVEVGVHGLKPWLRRVASNLCIDRIRAGRREDVVDEVPEVPQAPSQLRMLEEREVARRVDGAIRALPERQRLALTLFHYEAMSQAEIGAQLGISDEAVESLLARARRTLKSALAEDWKAMRETHDD